MNPGNQDCRSQSARAARPHGPHLLVLSSVGRRRHPRVGPRPGPLLRIRGPGGTLDLGAHAPSSAATPGRWPPRSRSRSRSPTRSTRASCQAASRTRSTSSSTRPGSVAALVRSASTRAAGRRRGAPSRRAAGKRPRASGSARALGETARRPRAAVSITAYLRCGKAHDVERAQRLRRRETGGRRASTRRGASTRACARSGPRPPPGRDLPGRARRRARSAAPSRPR